MMRFPLFFVWVLAAPAWAQTPAATEFFEKKIRPILVNRCQACHSAKIKTAGLDLSSAEGFVHGGQSGPIVVKGDPEADRKSTRLNSSHGYISYAVFCLKKKKTNSLTITTTPTTLNTQPDTT